MVLVLYQKKKGIGVVEISADQWMKCQTLLRWIEANPKIWKQIKWFVYRKKLHKGKIKLAKRGILDKLLGRKAKGVY